MKYGLFCSEYKSIYNSEDSNAAPTITETAKQKMPEKVRDGTKPLKTSYVSSTDDSSDWSSSGLRKSRNEENNEILCSLMKS